MKSYNMNIDIYINLYPAEKRQNDDNIYIAQKHNYKIEKTLQLSIK